MLSSFPLFTEHNLTWNYLSNLRPENVQWSLFCPSQMVPVSKTVDLLDAPRGNPLVASADAPTGFQQSYLHSIPYLGPFISLMSNIAKYNTTLEDCADFIATDVENKEPRFVGHRVSVINADHAGKGGKTE